MEITILVIIGALIILALAGYAVHLLFALQKQKKALQQARQARVCLLYTSPSPRD